MPPEQNSTGVALPYEKQAMRGDPMPDGLNYPDQLLYQALALLYARYRMGTVTREQATHEKKQLLEKHRVHQFNWEMGEHYVSVIKKTEHARSEYRKRRTLENADNLLASIDGGVLV